MITLQSVQSLFRETSPVPEELLKERVVSDFKRDFLTGTPDHQIQVDDSEYDQNGGIMVSVISSQAAGGYLAFEGQADYNDWLRQSLYQPSQDEIQEALGGEGAG